MENNVATDKDYELWLLCHQLHDVMVRIREEELRRQVGISRMQAAVLFIVKSMKVPATPAEISRWLFREPHSVSGLLNRMEKQGLVKKAKDLERKNLIRVVLTDKGEEAYRRSRDMKAVRGIMSSLSEEEKDNLRGYLGTLRNKALEEFRELTVVPQLPLP